MKIAHKIGWIQSNCWLLVVIHSESVFIGSGFESYACIINALNFVFKSKFKRTPNENNTESTFPHIITNAKRTIYSHASTPKMHESAGFCRFIFKNRLQFSPYTKFVVSAKSDANEKVIVFINVNDAHIVRHFAFFH